MCSFPKIACPEEMELGVEYGSPDIQAFSNDQCYL